MLKSPFLLTLASLVLLSALQAQDKRPNILFAFADDWGKYASAYAAVDGPGSVNEVIQTPHFDRVAKEGVLFKHAFVTAPSCTPCRSSILSGQYFFRTGRGAILQGAIWDSEIPTYPLILRKDGYHVGFTYKVWSPGTPKDAGHGGKEAAYQDNGRAFNAFSQVATKQIEAGKTVEEAKAQLFAEVEKNFDSFLADRKEGQPFCYWFGPTNVHRKWIAGSGKKLWGIDPDSLEGRMPEFLPDVHTVREDLADYLGEAMAFDTALGLIMKKLEEMGELNNTLIVVSGDHGAPGFPRGKCNLYDFGTHVALAARWPEAIPGDRVVEDFVNLMDLAPTFLEVGGSEIPEVMTGRSLMPVLTSDKAGQVDPERTWVITGRERHVANAREGQLPYPQRALRTKDFLYIHNFKPDRWPMGTPTGITDITAPDREALTENTFAAFGDLDASPTKAWIVENRNEPGMGKYYDYAFAKRPQEELYVISKDPDQIHNMADNPEYAAVRDQMREQLMTELKQVEDPRVTGDGMTFEKPPFSGPVTE